MFLKGFKAKSNQKFVENALIRRNVTASDKKIVSVGVLLNHSEFANYETINSFLDELKITTAKRKIFTFLNEKDQQENIWDSTFNTKDFGWRGKLKNVALQDFTKTKFDVLICYFLGNDAELKQIVAMSEAEFKVGISNKDERLYDLIIDVDTKDFELFSTELKKYLTILNKI